MQYVRWMVIAFVAVGSSAVAQYVRASCDKLSPADAAVLSKQQLSNRYCAAKMGVANAETVLKEMDERSITAENPVRRTMMVTSQKCFAAANNIAELYREKYRSVPPKPDLTKDCPGS